MSVSLSLSVNGGFIYTPAPSYIGADSFAYRVSDGGTPDSSPVTILPRFQADAAYEAALLSASPKVGTVVDARGLAQQVHAYEPSDWLLIADESHMTIPQVVGMYKNDRTRKEILVDFGFRLPSALDNRPLTFEEFEATVHQAVYMSATPGPYELERSEQITEQLIRPTGIVDPVIHVRPTEGQIDDLMEEIRKRVERGERTIVTTLTKRMAEDLTDYLRELGIKVQYLHAEVDTLERVAILRDLRLGIYDVLVGINLLREGIDLPEVTLVAILDADKEGFLRSAWSLIQMTGRAARNIGGEVVMYADRMTDSMKAAIDETNRRRAVQVQYNLDHGIEPTTIIKGIRDLNDQLRHVAESTTVYTSEREARDARLVELDLKKV